MRRVVLSSLLALTLVSAGAVSAKRRFADKVPTSKGKNAVMSSTTGARLFGTLATGEPVHEYILTNKNGMSARIISYGGIITELNVADKKGKFENVVLGFDNLKQYVDDSPYFGALIGRVANRIAHANFELAGVKFQLAKNDGDNCLHGGKIGFDKKVWKTQAVQVSNGTGLVLTLLSPDGDEKFPGNLKAKVRYELTDDDALRIDYEATCDKETPVNLTNHSYFNLTGNAKRDVLAHQLRLSATHYTPVDRALIPTGKIEPVAGTPFDFTQAHAIGQHIEKVNGGYDHNFVLDGNAGTLRKVLEVIERESGRTMIMETTEPGVQFYSGNFLDGKIRSRGVTYGKHAGFCLEAQRFPDALHHAEFLGFAETWSDLQTNNDLQI